MRTLRVLMAFVSVVAGVVSTAGSGGGGSSRGSVGIPPGCCSVPGPAPDAVITTANAQDVSATVVQSITQVFDVAVRIVGQISPSPPAAPDLLSSNSKFVLIATVAESAEDVADACAVCGTVTVSGLSWENDPGPMSLSAGDAFSLVLDNCNDGDGHTLDGSFSLNARGLDGDPRTDVFRPGYELHDNATVAASSGMNEYVTPLRVGFLPDWDSPAFPAVRLTASTTSLQPSSQADDYYWLYRRPVLTVNADISIPTTTSEAGVSFMDSTVLGGLVSCETTTPLQAPDGQDPESGEILISGGDGNGTIRIAIDSSTIVRLEIDPDGDGIVDDSRFTTWTAQQA